MGWMVSWMVSLTTTPGSGGGRQHCGQETEERYQQREGGFEGAPHGRLCPRACRACRMPSAAESFGSSWSALLTLEADDVDLVRLQIEAGEDEIGGDVGMEVERGLGLGAGVGWAAAAFAHLGEAGVGGGAGGVGGDGGLELLFGLGDQALGEIVAAELGVLRGLLGWWEARPCGWRASGRAGRRPGGRKLRSRCGGCVRGGRSQRRQRLSRLPLSAGAMCLPALMLAFSSAASVSVGRSLRVWSTSRWAPAKSPRRSRATARL